MKKCKTLLFLLLFISLLPIAKAQEDAKTIDSLKKLLPIVNDTSKLDIYNYLSIIAPDGEWQQYNQELKKLSLKYLNSKEKNKKIYYRYYAEALNNEAFDYTEKGDYVHAINNYEECAAIQKKFNIEQALGLTYSNLAAIYERDGDLVHAIEFNSKAREILERTKTYAALIAALSNLGVLYFKQKNPKKAKESYLRAYQIYEQYHPVTNTISTIVGNLGDIYLALQQNDSATFYYRIAMQKAVESGNIKGLSGSFLNYGQLYKAQGNLDSAISNYTKAFEIAQKNHYLSDLKTITNDLYELYKKQGNEAKALAVLEVNIQTDIELKSEENKRATIKFQIANEYAAKKAADSVGFAKAKAIDELQLQKQRILTKSIEQEKEIQTLAYEKTQSDLVAEQSKRGEKEKQLSITEKEKKLLISENEVARLYAMRSRGVMIVLFVALMILLLVSKIFYNQKEKRKKINLALSEEKQKSEDLLLNILPAEVAEELKETGGAKAKHFDNVTVLFTDFVNFTKVAETLTPQELVNELHTCFKAFDDIIGKHNIEKIKTIGDAYLAVCGLPLADELHPKKVVQAALEIVAFMQNRHQQMGNKTFEIRIGVNSGSVVAGIVGVKKFAYDIWGDTVNTAARMEQHSEAGKVNISGSTYELVKDQFHCAHRGKISAKGKGEIDMYFVNANQINKS